jgi:hypothetical protein
MAAPHRIKLSHVPSPGAAIEALAIFVDGFVEARRIASRDFDFEMMDDGFIAHLRHPASDNPPYKIIWALYNVMAGFHKAGADVEIDGPLTVLLPGTGRLIHEETTRPAFAVRQIFEDQLPENQRTLPIDPHALAEIHAALPSGTGIHFLDPRIFPKAVKDPRSAVTWLVTHRSGLEFAVLTADGLIRSHCILGHRPLSTCRLFGFPEPVAKRVRTWGEAWIGHSWGGKRSAPEGLDILPGEVAIVHDVSVHRYEIADRTTLDDRTRINFGEGPSAFAARVWLGMAEQCGDAGNYDLAARCCDEAAKCDADAATIALAREEAAHWRDWLDWSAANGREARAIRPSLVKPVAKLIARLPPQFAARIAEVAEAMRMEREDAHDHRRRVNAIPAWPETGQGAARFSLGYERLTGREMIASGIPPAVLTHLGAGMDPMPPPARFDNIFTVRAGNALIWGSVGTGCLVLHSKPAVAYSIDRH